MIGTGPVRTLSSARAATLSVHPDQPVIVILRDQASNGAARGQSRIRLSAAQTSAQQGVLSELAQVRATQVTPFHVVNAVAATVSSSEEDNLRRNPAVQAVVPDLVLHLPLSSRRAAPRSTR